MEFMENILPIKDISITEILIAVVVCSIFYIGWKKLLVKESIKVKLPPGPIGLPVVGYLPFLGKEPWKKIWKLKEKYGDIVGIYFGPKYTVILNGYEIAKEVLSHPAALNREPGFFNSAIKFGIGEINGKAWQEQRRFCFLTSKNLGLGKEHWQNLVLEEISDHIKKIKETKGQPFDASSFLYLSSASSTMSLLLGRRLQTPEEFKKLETVAKYNNLVFQILGPADLPTQIPGLRQIYGFFKVGRYKEYLKIARQVVEVFRDEIYKHKNVPLFKNFQSFINEYLEKIDDMTKSKSSEHSFSEDMLIQNMNTITIGAVDTTSVTLSWCFRLMAKHPDVQDKVYTELMSSIGKEGKARYEDRNSFPYTFAVIMEVLRFASSIPLSTPRWVSEDIHIHGYVIPKGSNISANSWGLNHDPNYWKNPDEFKPERFLTNNGSELVKQPESYAIFSFGKRDCPGSLVAYRHILFVFTEILKTFEISVPKGEKLTFETKSGLICRLTNQRLCFKERENSFS